MLFESIRGSITVFLLCYEYIGIDRPTDKPLLEAWPKPENVPDIGGLWVKKGRRRGEEGNVVCNGEYQIILSSSAYSIR